MPVEGHNTFFGVVLNELLCLTLLSSLRPLLRGVRRSADARPLPPLDPAAFELGPLAAMSNAVKPPSGHLSITKGKRRREAAAEEEDGQKREQSGGGPQTRACAGDL